LGKDPDLMQIVHPTEKPAVKPKMQRTNPELFRDLSVPSVHAVGKTFARAIER
jgi:hypothetical protein